MRSFMLKISAVFLRLHLYINRKVKQGKAIVPYKVKDPALKPATRIVHVNGNFIVGGSSQLIVDIIENIADLYQHSVIVPAVPDPLSYQPLDIRGYGLTNMQELYTYLKNEPPALVHIHYWVRQQHWYADYAIWYRAVFDICAALDIPVVQNINVPTEPYHSKAVLENIFVSNYVRDHFNRSQTPSGVIYPGSDFSHFKQEGVHGLPANSIGMVYRLDKDKLNAAAIEIFIGVAKQRPSVTCHIVGGGYFLKHYQKRVSEEQLQQQFVFTGMVSYAALPGYYKKLGLFIAPVHDESFGQVTPFAMNMGIPVAGYNTGALEEILGSADTLAAPGDIDGLVHTITTLLDDPQQLKLLGEQNKARASAMFSLDIMIRDYRKLYGRLINAPVIK
jgi:glycosyltransferase involved in cell wall biosynthesis